jgi:hypothetical protein
MSVWIDAKGKMHCPSCNKVLTQLTVYHAKECTSKQLKLEEESSP